MLTKDEINAVNSAKESGNPLTKELKTKVVSAIKNKEEPFSSFGETICCDTGMDYPNRYVACDSQTCVKTLGGTVVANSYCGL